jgi:hypothetical protein
VYTIKINSARGVKKSTVLHEFMHLLGLYHSFDPCKPGGECVKTDGDASIMSYVSPPDKGFSSVDIEWLQRVYGPPKNTTSINEISMYQFDMILPSKNITSVNNEVQVDNKNIYMLFSLTIILILLISFNFLI